MKPSRLSIPAALALLLAVSGCGQKTTAAKSAPELTAEAAPKPEANLVTLTRENLAHVDLQTETAARGSLARTLKAAGQVGEDLNKTAKVRTTLEGRLIKLNFDLNQPVKAGDIMGLVETPELLGKALELKAPIDGLVTERKSTVGERIGRDTDVYTISDPTDLWALAEIKERDIGAVHLGQEAAFTVLAYPGEAFHGRIVLIGNKVETASRTLEVRIAVNNADGRLRPGMFADIEITTTMLADVLIIPDTALQTDGDEQIVFVKVGDGKFEKRAVKLGLEQHGRVQVISGVKAGEPVVTAGSFILKSELLKSEMEAG